MIDLEKLIPQRPPFLFVDEIMELQPGKCAVGKKYVREDEQYFRGHFPQKPVMPGVLIIEAAGQLVNAVIRSMDGYRDCFLYYSKISKVNFYTAVFPGEELTLEAIVKDHVEDVFFCSVRAWKGDMDVFRAEMAVNIADL